MRIEPQRFEDAPELKIAGLRAQHTMANMAQTMGPQWESFLSMGPVPAKIGDDLYGVYCRTDLEAGTLEYMCGAEVSTFARPVDAFHRLIAPAGRYAVFRHEGPAAALGVTWAAIMGPWTRESGVAQREAPTFERYGPNYDPTTGAGGLDIWIPIEADR